MRTEGAERHVTVVEELELARRAYEGQAWTETSARLAALDQQAPLAVDDLIRWGTACHLRGDREQSRRLLQRGHDQAAGEQDPCAAARCAFWLGMSHVETGQHAVAAGWFSRAGEHLERGPEDCPERGYLLLPQALMRLEGGDLAGAQEAVEQVRAVGERHQVPDLQVVGTHVLGRLRLYRDDIAGGLTLLDHAMTGLLSSRLTPILAGQVYCSTVEACQELGDLDRVRQWTAALVQWCQEQPDLVPYTGQCAVHRGQLMALDGALDDACQEFRLACERYQQIGAPFAAGLARYEEGEVHRLRGEYDAARGCYDEAAEHGHDGHPGRALLALATGDEDAALPGLERALAESTGPVRRLRVLPAVARVATETGELDHVLDYAEPLPGPGYVFMDSPG
ncbi:helix-turn-helix transcriptional regulator, partial [Ornithinicoccus halotolerans]|uniref:helix-turn-helix transcriptional regulator n=1 Tax=Ornithinicoccus halotolerans TaxID=1748220 RepID=UPI001297F0C4